MRKLDDQGRHRSEWCYAAYDDRRKEIQTAGKWTHPKNIKSITKITNEWYT